MCRAVADSAIPYCPVPESSRRWAWGMTRPTCWHAWTVTWTVNWKGPWELAMPRQPQLTQALPVHCSRFSRQDCRTSGRSIPLHRRSAYAPRTR